MPQKHKHVPGTAYRRNYDPENIELALEQVVNNHLSFGQAATRFGVPKTTLYSKYKGIHSDILGRPSVLSKIEERKIANAMITAADFGYPFVKQDIKEFVQSYLNQKGVIISCFDENLPGNDWLEYFLKRNPTLTQRNAENIKRARAEVDGAVINQYFDRIEETLRDALPENIINYDETNFTDDPGKQKVFIKKGNKHARRILDNSKSSTSVMFAATAGRELLPLYVVYQAKHLYPEWIERGPPGTIYNRSKNGWFDGPIFEDWFQRVAMKYFRTKEGKKILIGDNLQSHLSEKVIRACHENNISFAFLPPNSTHICQPLDVAVFHPLKMIWRNVLTQWKKKYRGVVPKTEFPCLLNELIEKARPNISNNIKSGFASCGLVPVNRDRVLQKVVPRRQIDHNDDALQETFTNIMRRNTTTPENPNKKRGKKIDVPPGKAIYIDDLNNNPQPGPSNSKKKQPAPSNSKTQRKNYSDSDISDGDLMETDKDQPGPSNVRRYQPGPSNLKKQTRYESDSDISDDDFMETDKDQPGPSTAKRYQPGASNSKKQTTYESDSDISDDDLIETDKDQPGPSNAKQYRPGPSNSKKQKINETDSDNSDDDLETDSEDSETISDNEKKTDLSLIPIETIGDISVDCFVITEFIYNAKTKKETKKKFVSKIMNISTDKNITVQCLRPYKGLKNKFVYPDVPDKTIISLKQVKFSLPHPEIRRGMHIFNNNIDI